MAAIEASSLQKITVLETESSVIESIYQVLLGHEAEVHAVLPDPKVEAGGDVSDPHGVVPVDVAARPLDPRQLQPPQGPSLLHDGAALVHDDAEWFVVINDLFISVSISSFSLLCLRGLEGPAGGNSQTLVTGVSEPGE